MLTSGYQTLLDIIDMLLYEVATFPPNSVKIDPKKVNGSSFSKFKMAAAAVLDSGYPAFVDIIDMLIF